MHQKSNKELHATLSTDEGRKLFAILVSRKIEESKSLDALVDFLEDCIQEIKEARFQDALEKL